MMSEPQQVAALLQEVAELPDPQRSLLTHNERALIEFCGRLGAALPAPDARTQAYVFGLLAEEAGEVLQLVGKALRFGLDTPGRLGPDGDVLPDTPRTLLPCELGDLLAAVEFAIHHELVDGEAVHAAYLRKLARLLDPAALDNLGRPLAPQPGPKAAGQ